jgi:alpha/beta superfamily hydrolase
MLLGYLRPNGRGKPGTLFHPEDFKDGEQFNDYTGRTFTIIKRDDTCVYVNGYLGIGQSLSFHRHGLVYATTKADALRVHRRLKRRGK